MQVAEIHWPWASQELTRRGDNLAHVGDASKSRVERSPFHLDSMKGRP